MGEEKQKTEDEELETENGENRLMKFGKMMENDN